MRQTNFHTHTSRCHHAFGNDEEFVRAAIQNGFEVLGFRIMHVGNMIQTLWRICV